MGILKVKRGPGVRTTGVAGPQAKGRNWANETTLSREQQGAMGASARRVVRSGGPQVHAGCHADRGGRREPEVNADPWGDCCGDF